jgi:hypothetical protein
MEVRYNKALQLIADSAAELGPWVKNFYSMNLAKGES